MKKIHLLLVVCLFLSISPIRSQEYSELQIPNYTKIVTQNITDGEYNTSFKDDYEVLFWGDENSLVEFFYTSHNEDLGLRMVANSDGAYTLEVKSIVNLTDVDSMMQVLYPPQRPQITNMTLEKYEQMRKKRETWHAEREKYRLENYQISTSSTEVNRAFVDQIKGEMSAVLMDKKYNPVRNYITSGGEMAVFRTIEGKDVISIVTNNPETHLKEIVDVFVQMTEDVREGDFSQTHYTGLLDLF